MMSPTAPAIQGTVTVIAGDTIEIRGVWIRLGAIDAPEKVPTSTWMPPATEVTAIRNWLLRSTN